MNGDRCDTTPNAGAHWASRPVPSDPGMERNRSCDADWTMTSDPFDLDRFIVAQSLTYEAALAELRAGAKRSHWMWFVFPQFAGLGSSSMAVRYAVRSLDEARAYVRHPVIGSRLRECVEAMQSLDHTTADAVLGAVDAAKFRSSLTLFQEAGGGRLFASALERWFGGAVDDATLALIAELQRANRSSN